MYKCISLTAIALLAACTATPHVPLMQHKPELGASSRTLRELQALPAPPQRIAVAVYGFADQTGQFKPSDAGQSLSRAVSQGGTSILVKALQDAGQNQWFSIVEREHLDDLLKERQIIREMRQKYMGEQSTDPNVLPPMLYAGVIFEGGIVGFDSNTLTGGLGAKFLGIGASTKYKQDTVSVYLRAVSTKTGEVLASVTVRKSIASISIQGDAFRFVDFKQLLEAESGVTNNEPAEFALQQAIQKAVIALVLEGSERGLWDFADKDAGVRLMDKYDHEKGVARPVKLAVAVTPPAPAPVARATKDAPDVPLTDAKPKPAFDPAAAATQGGSAGISSSAAGVAPPSAPAPVPAPVEAPKDKKDKTSWLQPLLPAVPGTSKNFKEDGQS